MSATANIEKTDSGFMVEAIQASDTKSTNEHEHDVESAQDKDHPQAEPEETPFKPAVDLSEGRIRLEMMAVILSLVAIFLDTFLLSPALPIIALELSASAASYAWIASALLLATAVSVPILGKASDIFGRRAIMISANLLFILGAVIGGLAHSVAALIVARLIQGVGCGGLLIVANICVMDLFSPRKRGIYFSMIGTVSAIASAAGPVLGGLFATAASWRWCFWINLPIAGISFIVQLLFLKLTRPRGQPALQHLKNVDWLGAFTLTAATILTLVGLQLGGTAFPWSSPSVICPIVLGIVMLACFCWNEKSLAKQPLIPLSIFAHVSRAATTIAMIAQAIVSSGAKYFLVLYFQLVFGLSPLESAVYYLPYAVGLGCVLPFIGWSIKKTGKYRLIICSGAFVLTVGAGLLIINTKPERNWPLIVIPQILLAVGVGLTYQSTTIAFQAQIKDTQGTAGQSAFQLFRTYSQVISIVLGQIVFQAQVSARIRQLDNSMFDSNATATLASGNTFEALSLIQRLEPRQINLIRSLLALSFQDMWIFYTAISFVGLACSFGIADVHMV